MTKYEKIEEIITEYYSGGDFTAEEALQGIEDVLNDDKIFVNEIEVETAAGKFYAHTDTFSEDVGISVEFEPADCEGERISLFSAECPCEEHREPNMEEKDISISIWKTSANNEYAHKSIIKKADIEQALNIEPSVDNKDVLPAVFTNLARKHELEIIKTDNMVRFEYSFVKHFPEGYDYSLLSISAININGKNKLTPSKNEIVTMCQNTLKDIANGVSDFGEDARECAEQIGYIINTDENGVPFAYNTATKEKDYDILWDISSNIEKTTEALYKDIVAFEKDKNKDTYSK